MAKSDSLRCLVCNFKAKTPRLLGLHRWQAHKISGSSHSSTWKRKKKKIARAPLHVLGAKVEAPVKAKRPYVKRAHPRWMKKKMGFAEPVLLQGEIAKTSLEQVITTLEQEATSLRQVIDYLKSRKER